MSDKLQEALASLVSTLEWVVFVVAVIAIWKWLDL
jgi:hypothetical protein